ncbi:MAG: hypothetical protein GY882_14350, partial [Actinomycetia bacterium]|nr:hypothetical protein [Actinomycetes bacterium]
MTLWTAWWVVACVVDDEVASDVDSEALHDTVMDSADTDLATDTSVDAPVATFEIERVAETTLPTARGPGCVLASRVSGTIYLPEASGEVVRVLSDLYVGPSGDYCLDGGAGGTCEGGTLWTSDRVEPSRDIQHLCFDDHRGRLFLVHGSGSTIEVVDIDPAGEEAYTYRRTYEVVQLPDELTAEASWTGPCHYDPSRDALVLTSPDGPTAAVIDLETHELLDQVDFPGAAEAFWPLDQGDVVALTHEGLFRLTGSDFEVAASIDEIGISVASVDRGTGEVLYAHGDGTLLSTANVLDEQP